MTKAKKQRKASDKALLAGVRRHVEFWQKLGFAGDWWVVIESEFLHGEAAERAASIEWAEGYRNAHLLINTAHAAWKMPSSVGRRLVLHEMLHLVQAPSSDVMTLNFSTQSALRDEYMRNLESVTDSLSSIIFALVNKKD